MAIEKTTADTPFLALGLRIVAGRKRRNWTQTDLAAEMEPRTTQAHISQVENGKEAPIMKRRLWLSEHFGIAAYHWDRVERAMHSAQQEATK